MSAVEPQQAMRDVLAARIGAERVLEGLAEAIPLPGDAVGAVTVADGFHWFHPEAALAEIRRVLTPGGGLAILTTLPDWSGASWADDLGAMMVRLRPEHPFFDGPAWQEAVRAAGGWSEPRQIRVTTAQPNSAERVVDHLASMSWIAAMAEPERSETLAKIKALLDAGETPAELDVHVVIGLASLL